jgi:hypothetical protein
MAIPKLNTTVRSIEELIQIQRTIAAEFNQHMAKLAKDYMQNYIFQKVYLENSFLQDGGGLYYERTGDLAEAVVCTQSKNGEWKVGIDGRKLHAIPRESADMWGQHTSIHGVAQSTNMAEWVNAGNDSPLYSYNGIEYMQATENYINKISAFEWKRFKALNGL